MGFLPNIIDGHVVDQEAIDKEKEELALREVKREATRRAARNGIVICKRKKNVKI